MKITTEEIIIRCTKKHNNKYDYSLLVYDNMKSKIKIICPEHGIFNQQLYSHLNGSGCPKCADNRLNNEIFIKKSKEIHGDKYDYSLVNYKNAKTKVKIICPYHGEFLQNPNDHLYKKRGCIKCNKMDTDKFIKKSKEIHNNKYDYRFVEFINYQKKVKIICHKHGIFEQSPANHLNKKGCSKCKGMNRTTKEFIELSKNKHNNKYDYSLSVYTKSHKKVKIICKKHGIFEQTPHDHLSGNGCKKCIKTDINDFIKRSSIEHNNKYDYSSIKDIKNQKTKINIICPSHGIFSQSVVSHIHGSGCPKCKESKGERIIRNYIEKIKICYETQKTFNGCKHKRKLKFDFYLPEYNMCIEYDGKQHFELRTYWGGEEGLKDRQHKDNIKNNFCKDNNIKLVRIKYDMDITEELDKLF